MSVVIPEDAASLLEQFVHDVANTPAEVTHLLEEIQAKDSQIFAFKDEINKRDFALQRWVRNNGGHVFNPKEEALSRTINDCYDKCEILQAEKCGLSEKALIVLERQIKRLDLGLRHLAAREEFPAASEWGGPSLLSGSGSVTGVSTPVSGAPVASAGQHIPLQAVSGNVGATTTTGGTPSIANAAQMRMAAQAASARAAAGAANTQTPTALPRAHREGSSESNKRRRLNASLGTLPAASSNLRQSSLGPGTPGVKPGTPGPSTSRAGSAQPRPSGTASATTATTGQKKPHPGLNRKSGPPTNAAARKRDRERMRAVHKKGFAAGSGAGGAASETGSQRRARHLHSSSRATPSTNASLSSAEDSDPGASPSPSSLARGQADGATNSHHHHLSSSREKPDGDGGDDDEEEEDDPSLYCLCQRKSFGDMIGCDNENCEFQWFHYGCVGVTKQPEGEWLCPNCRKMPRDKIVKDTSQ